MTPDQRRAHVLEKADELGAVVIVDRDLVCGWVIDCDGKNDPHGYAIYRKRPFNGGGLLPPFVVLSHDPGVSSESYLVALHELGHLTKGRRGTTFEHEEFAWRWALKSAGEPTSPGVWARIARDLASYRDNGQRCRPSKAFDRLLRQAERNGGNRN